MKTLWRDLFLLAFISLFSTILVWLPFALRLTSFWNIPLPPDGMAAVVRNFDGPHYLVVAKSLYQPNVIKQFEFDEPVEYYAAHYPLYPLLIRVIGSFISYPYALLTVTLISSVLLTSLSYLLFKKLQLPQPFWLSVLLLFLPARWLIARSVGSPEPLFVSLVLLSIYGMLNRNYWLAGIAGALAQWTKPPGILLFIAYSAYLGWETILQISQVHAKSWWKSIPWRAYPLLLIPLSLLGLFFWYATIYGNFWAYFNSGDNIHLFWPPFQIFNRAAAWVGSFWLEDIVWILLIGVLATILNWSRQDPITWFTLIFFASTIFVSHRDLSRYNLPLTPFLIIAFAPFLTSKTFRLAFWIILIPIYLFAINFIAGNTTPISDWSRLL